MTNAPLPAYQIDESRWPLVVITPTETVTDAAALDLAYVGFDALARKRRPMVLLLDIRGAVSDPARRKRLTAWADSKTELVDAYLVATGVVVGSPLERGFATAALWLLSPRGAVRVFSDRPAAVEWLLKLYDERHPTGPDARG